MMRLRPSWPLILFLVALGLRLMHLVTIRDSPFFSILYIDPLMYDEWGQRIASGQLFSDRPFFLDPLYPYFLGAVFAAFGHSFEAVVGVQSVLGAAVAPFVYLAARRWFGPATAKTAGVIAAVYVPSIYFGGLIMKPGFSLALVALALWLLSAAIAEPGVLRRWIAAGVILGLACLTRGNLVLVMPCVVLWVLMRAEVDEPSGSRPSDVARRALRGERPIQAGALAVGVALVLAIPALHNLRVSGEFILTTANAGANFYIGNNPSNRTGEYQQLPFIRANPKYEQTDFAAEAARRAGREMTDREISAFWFGETFRSIRQHPLDWLKLLARKVHSFWGAFEIPDSVDYYLYREYAPVLRLPLPGFGLLAPLALLGAGIGWHRRGWPRLLLWFVGVYSATIVFFFVFSRFRMVVAPALFVFAAFGATELVRRWRAVPRGKTELRHALLATVAFFVLLAFVNLPVRARPEAWSARLARAVGLPVKPETSSLGHYNLGVAYAREAKAASDPAPMLQSAELELRRALELAIDLEHARIHVELGKVLARQQRNRDAIVVYREGLTLEPRDWKIHHALGLLSEREGDHDAAARAFRDALELAPAHVPSALKLGRALLELQRAEEAARFFRHALKISPGNREATLGLRDAERVAEP